MALGSLRLALSRAVICGHGCKSPGGLPLLLLCKPQPTTLTHLGLKLQRWAWFSTTVSDGGDPAETEPQEKRKKKKHDPKARTTIGSVGRKIYQRHLLLLDERGANMGTVHRADALRLMDERGLKLVPVNEHAEPPVFRLMSGKQIHEEQMRLREKQKSKNTGPIQMKDLTVSSDIALHDLDTKLKQVANWLEKKHHVRLTVKGRHGPNENTLDSTLDDMVASLTVPFGYVSKPKLIREGRAASCVLRPPSAKELQQQAAKNKAEESTKVPESDPERREVSGSSGSETVTDSRQH
ncbi:translation initiation factor IF-3, mitochondrial isoform X2 [Trichomycterus rosablanca]